jgi:hypothetical protein
MPVHFLVETGNLDGIMLGLILMSIFPENGVLKAFAFSLSIIIKIYSVILFAPLILARKWVQVAVSAIVLPLLLLPFHSLFSSFIRMQAGRTIQVAWLDNICPMGALAVFGHNHVLRYIYLVMWIASYGYMLFKNRNSPLSSQMIYSLAWMLAMPMQVIPYTGILLLPLLALKSHEITVKNFVAVSDRLFLIGFCLVGFQQTAVIDYFQSFPLAIKLFGIVNPIGTILVIVSLVLALSGPHISSDEPAQVDAEVACS